MFSFSFNANYNKKYLKKNTINSFAKQKDYIPNKVLLKDIFPKVNNNLILNDCNSNNKKISMFDQILINNYLKRDLFYEPLKNIKRNSIKCQTFLNKIDKSTQTDETKDSEDFIVID